MPTGKSKLVTTIPYELTAAEELEATLANNNQQENENKQAKEEEALFENINKTPDELMPSKAEESVIESSTSVALETPSATTSEPSGSSEPAARAALSRTVQKKTLPEMIKTLYRDIKVQLMSNKKCNIGIYREIENILPYQVINNKIIHPDSGIDMRWFYTENEKKLNYKQTLELMIRQYDVTFKKYSKPSVNLGNQVLDETTRIYIHDILSRRLSALREIKTHRYIEVIEMRGGGKTNKNKRKTRKTKRYIKRKTNKRKTKIKTKRNKRKTRK